LGVRRWPTEQRVRTTSWLYLRPPGCSRPFVSQNSRRFPTTRSLRIQRAAQVNTSTPWFMLWPISHAALFTAYQTEIDSPHGSDPKSAENASSTSTRSSPRRLNRTPCWSRSSKSVHPPLLPVVALLICLPRGVVQDQTVKTRRRATWRRAAAHAERERGPPQARVWFGACGTGQDKGGNKSSSSSRRYASHCPCSGSCTNASGLAQMTPLIREGRAEGDMSECWRMREEELRSGCVSRL